MEAEINKPGHNENIREHLEMVLRMDIQKKPMKTPEITNTDVKKHLTNTRNDKAAGPDKLKPKLCKILAKSDICVNVIKYGMNKILNTTDLPDGRKKSNTKLMPKVKQPKGKANKPLAMTDTSNKMLMKAAVGEKVENHLKEN